MNLYAVVILATLVVHYVLQLIADLLNLRALATELPAELADVWDAEAYAKAQRYTRERTRFGLVAATVGLLALCAFWFGGGFNALDVWLRGFGFGAITTGLLYVGALLLLQGALDLPFSLYSTFVIEERFGMNRTTVRTFVLDRLKGLLLAAAIGAPLLAAVLYFFARVGGEAWLYCWAVTTVFTLALLLVFPTWILPLFNKFEPLAEGELRRALARYAESVGFALRDIFVIDGSRRSSRSNAYFTGLGRSKRIALYDTLIERHTVPELVAVLAHEAGHSVKKHVVKGLVLSVLHSGVMFFLLGVFLRERALFNAFGMEHVSVYAGLIFFGLLYSPIELLLSLFLHAQSRRHEFEADRFAAETTGDPEAMATVLKKLSADNLDNLHPHPLHVFLNYSHPPVLARIAAVRQYAA